MKRKTSIIISVTGITLVLLILLGLTYGYFLTNIEENPNTESLNVTIGEMSIDYTDLSTESTSEIIMPGYVNTKLFTIRNLGTIDANYSIYLTDVQNEFVRSDDITYTLYRKIGNNTIDTTDYSDCEVISTGVFPKANTYIKTNEIISGDTEYYTYALVISYINSTENQDIDQGKIFSAKVQIHAVPESPYEDGTLANEIFNNSIAPNEEQLALGYARLTVPSPTTPAQEISGENESVLSVTNDDLGISYYFRGAVKNNYVTFNKMCWRIVRIEGDGSIKLALASVTGSCDNEGALTDGSAFIGSSAYNDTVSYSSIVADYNNGDMKKAFNAFLNGGSFESYDVNWNATTITYTGFSDENKLKINTKNVCIGDITNKYDVSGNLLSESAASSVTDYWYYNSYIRLNGMGQTANATLTCNEYSEYINDIQMMPLTADEVVCAGATVGSANSNYYLNENALTNSWYTFTPSRYDFVYGPYDDIFVVSTNGMLGDNYPFGSNISVRPAISLSSTELFSGTGKGTQDDPYVIE